MDNDNQPVTKAGLRAELTELRAEINARFEDQDQKFQGRLDVSEQRTRDWMNERLHDMETRILQAIYSHAETNNQRLAQNEATTTVLTSRVTTLESRVLGIEKRLNIPPAA